MRLSPAPAQPSEQHQVAVTSVAEALQLLMAKGATDIATVALSSKCPTAKSGDVPVCTFHIVVVSVLLCDSMSSSTDNAAISIQGIMLLSSLMTNGALT